MGGCSCLRSPKDRLTPGRLPLSLSPIVASPSICSLFYAYDLLTVLISQVSRLMNSYQYFLIFPSCNDFCKGRECSNYFELFSSSKNALQDQSDYFWALWIAGLSLILLCIWYDWPSEWSDFVWLSLRLSVSQVTRCVLGDPVISYILWLLGLSQ